MKKKLNLFECYFDLDENISNNNFSIYVKTTSIKPRTSTILRRLGEEIENFDDYIKQGFKLICVGYVGKHSNDYQEFIKGAIRL